MRVRLRLSLRLSLRRHLERIDVRGFGGRLFRCSGATCGGPATDGAHDGRRDGRRRGRARVPYARTRWRGSPFAAGGRARRRGPGAPGAGARHRCGRLGGLDSRFDDGTVLELARRRI